MITDGNTAQEKSIFQQPGHYLSRDLSWLKFNERVLDQVGRPDKTIFERLNFLMISASNLDEFFMIRVGRLYNYIDYNRKWLNKMGLQVVPFRDELLKKARVSFQKQHEYFLQEVNPLCEANHFVFVQDITTLNHQEQNQLKHYFKKAVFPMLTPMVFDGRRVFPALANKLLVFGVVTHNPAEKEDNKKISFVQLPQNLSRFYRLYRSHSIAFIPIEAIVREHMSMFFRNITILLL